MGRTSPVQVLVGMRLREVKSEESSCPSVGKRKGSGKETILPGTLGAPCPLSLEAEARNDISQAPVPSSCRRCPRLAAQTGQPGTSLLVLLGGAPGGGAGDGSVGSSLGMQWPGVIRCDRLSTVKPPGLLRVAGGAASAACL